ncbi:Inhibitor of growth protein 3 [Nymphon striatum]|nr:Inhibitor of growth protein 3 [Nymphon striatum]
MFMPKAHAYDMCCVTFLKLQLNMLYLEDYLEMIEHVPQELRYKFTEIREMDLQISITKDNLDKQVKVLFQNAKKIKPEQRDTEFGKIRQEYYKSLEEADEKVQIANQIYDLVDRYLRRLDQELQKFKMELEADNAGITEILEKRSLELDIPPPGQKAEKRKYQTSSMGGNVVLSNHIDIKRPTTEKDVVVVDKEPLTFRGMTNHNPASNLSSSSSSSSSNSFSAFTSQNAPTGNPATSDSSSIRVSSQSAPAISYNLGHMGAGSNAIAAAASQAIAATQQMQQGRRTASLKASYEAINSGFPNINRDFNFGGRDSSAANHLQVNPTPPQPSEPKVGRPKKQSSRASQVVQPQQQATTTPPITNAAVGSVTPTPDGDSVDPSLSEPISVTEETGSGNDWAYDPNEPRYCLCNQVSYGDMVACDNADAIQDYDKDVLKKLVLCEITEINLFNQNIYCPFEWFHYACVGISQPPKGKWYCPRCTSAMKRRGRKDR